MLSKKNQLFQDITIYLEILLIILLIKNCEISVILKDDVTEDKNVVLNQPNTNSSVSKFYIKSKIHI